MPVIRDSRQPIELQRQVQIGAGTLVLLGVLLSQLEGTGFLALSAGEGAGLILAGVTGWCGLARLLAAMPWKMPWNKRSATDAIGSAS